MKKSTKIIIGVLIPVFIITAALAVYIPVLLTPLVKIDFSAQSELTGKAAGFLYGFAEPDIPSAEIAESAGVNSLATKPAGGLQHPIGEITQVAGTFFSAGGELIVVYTQDMYDTWYYQLDSLEEYNEKVNKTVSEMEELEYSESIAYCIYNEMDNGQWFGDFSVKENREIFYDAWLSTYNVVKEINPQARIAGPGHAVYNRDYLEEFLSYCIENGCLPDIMVWHELAEDSIYHMESHFEEYYLLCDSLGIDRIPVCISEYGLMKTNGIPGESVKWINRLESQDAYGCVAYWRLADNLSDTVADDVTPNSNYWVYNFYAQMKGKELAVSERDILKSNMGKFLKGKADLAYKGLTACASFSDTERKFYVLAGGTDRTGRIVIENIDEACFKSGDKVTVKVNVVDYKGLGGAVYEPEELMTKTCTVRGGKIKFSLPAERSTQAFLIEITPFTGEEDDFEDDIFDRYEAEDAKLYGSAQATDWIAYACSEGKVVKGLDSASEIEFTVKADDDGLYAIDFVYGCGPVGAEYNEDGSVKNKGERISADVTVTVNGNAQNGQTLVFPSTIKEDYMECVTGYFQLREGRNTISIKCSNAVLSLDFIDVYEHDDDDEDEVYFDRLELRGADESDNVFSIYAKEAGNYNISLTDYRSTEFVLNGTALSDVRRSTSNESYITLYLQRGYSKLEIKGDAAVTEIHRAKSSADYKVVSPGDFTVFGSALLEDNENTLSGKKIGWISSDNESGCKFTVTAEKAGYYQFTIEYANNEEGGFHDYNVDLIERYITVSVNGEKRGNYFFRSTYSWENYKTRTITLYLDEGENEISFTNDGSYSFNNKITYAPDIGTVTVNPI